MLVEKKKNKKKTFPEYVCTRLAANLDIRCNTITFIFKTVYMIVLFEIICRRRSKEIRLNKKFVYLTPLLRRSQ